MTAKQNVRPGGRVSRPVLNTFAQNVMLERQLWLRRLLDPRRDINAECGHPEFVAVADYKKAFLRGDLATRVVTVLPEESWAESPTIFETQDEIETEFETAWKELEKKFKILSMLLRADILSGIGRFGVILLGLDDGLALSDPPPGVDDKGGIASGGKHELLFLRTFDEELVTVHSLESDITNPRY